MRAVVRVVVLLLLSAGLALGVGLAADRRGGSDTGAGLVAFASAVVVSFVWSLLDARHTPVTRVLVRWLVVAVGYAVGMVALIEAVDPGSFDVGAFLRDLPATGLFDALLVVVPAVVGAFIGAAVGRARHPESAG